MYCFLAFAPQSEANIKKVSVELASIVEEKSTGAETETALPKFLVSFHERLELRLEFAT
jgi:hypothetical protein